MKQMLDRRFYKGLRLLSALCTPFVAPFLAFVVLFFFTYLAILPLSYRLLVLLIVYLFTIFLPAMGFHLYRRLMGWKLSAWRDRKKRLVPYAITLFCYLLCYFVMQRMSLPRYMYGIIMGVVVATALSALANFRWKVSEHMIPLGGGTAGVVIFSFLLNYNRTSGNRKIPIFAQETHPKTNHTPMQPIVSIIMGSTSDLKVMEKAAAFFDEMEIPFEINALSAHRTPAAVEAFARGAQERGVKVIIAAAGMAAALPGVIAANTCLPVIGVPIASSFDGMDALLAIVQMPPGIPVATVAVGGALNSAILAMQILAQGDPVIAAKLSAYKEGLKAKIEKANRDLAEVKYKFKTN